jgi:hypothetical protein
MACSCRLKRKQKWKKSIIKSWKKDYISLGKTQKREKPTSKSRTNTGKIGKTKTKMPLRT